ncbi:MAG: amino acid transporter permease [Conexibacter sp.]|nr:amino acid transporter permease [Conexibacter sp.]
MLVTLWSGVVLGAVYATVALGFTISMLPSGVFNFAHGAIIVCGAYLTYELLTVHHVALVGVIVLDAVAGLVLGALCELVCVRPLRRSADVDAQRNVLLTTIGLSTLIVGVIGSGWGYEPKAVPFTAWTTPVHALGIVARPAQIVLLIGATASALGLHLWSRRTRLGQACLAVAEDRDAAALRGINVGLLSLAGFAAAGAFGAVSAIAVGPITYATPMLSVTLALGGFAAIALGGHGNFLGGLLGGLLVGVVSALATRYVGAAYTDLAVFGLLVTALTARPGGLRLVGAARHV